MKMPTKKKNDIYSFSPENRLVLASCNPSPDLNKLWQAIKDIDDWDKACDKLIKKGVAPLFLHILEKNSACIMSDNLTRILKEINENAIEVVPKVVVAKLKQAYLKTMTRNMVLFDVFREIAEKMNQKGVKAVALKGIYLAEHLYSDIGLRQLSDIDLLVKNDELTTVIKIFEELGFKKSEFEFGNTMLSVLEPTHLPPFTRKGVSVEVHTRLHGPTHRYQLPVEDMIERSVKTVIWGQSFHVFEVHDLIIYLCLHADKHLNSNHLQLYSYADITRLLTMHRNEIDWEIFQRRINECRGGFEVMKQLKIANQLFDAPIPDKALEGLSDKLSLTVIDIFNNHLEDKPMYETGTKTHLYYIRKVKTFKGKLLYLVELVFPKKKVMIRMFSVKNSRLYWLWYPYRWWVGLKALLR